jgi:hypothetical protein
MKAGPLRPRTQTQPPPSPTTPAPNSSTPPSPPKTPPLLTDSAIDTLKLHTHFTSPAQPVRLASLTHPPKPQTRALRP